MSVLYAINRSLIAHHNNLVPFILLSTYKVAVFNPLKLTAAKSSLPILMKFCMKKMKIFDVEMC